ncbi:reticulon-4-like isoform X2 [Hippocampus comes]|uniref:reticulon-4-like isoform X2 n=1 Tax=Hippocampus comes TaxID=109280 RepID=UPI00094EDED2|nr:PREDICTED: reticulon-4-like isoform X2 [Hippocampus comes]
MADNEEQEQQVSSSSALFSDLVHHYQAEPEAEPELYTGLPLDEQPKQDLFSLDDIVDLVGGAQDALERHMAEDEEPHGFTEPHEEEPDLLDPQPDPVPHLREEQEAEEDEQLMPDSSDTSSFRHTPSLSDASREAEPQVCPESDALPASPATQPAAPSPAHAAQTPADTQPARAPVSYAPSSPSKPQPLMQFPTDLGKKGGSPAPISPLSPLHSPDSLEELSLTESPNQPYPPGSAVSQGSFCTRAPAVRSKEMSWEDDEEHSRPGLSQDKGELHQLTGPYLSLGKDPGPHVLCEDSGVSFSPEEKHPSSEVSPVTPQMVVKSDIASSNPTEHWDSPLLGSQDNAKVSMDSFSKEAAAIGSPGYESELLSNPSDEDDDLMYEAKKNNNPFDGFSPLADSGSYNFGESKSDPRAVKVSDSPTPDLVQSRQSEELQDSPPSFLDEGKTFESGMKAIDSLRQPVGHFSSDLEEEDEEEEEEDTTLPPSLPDILKSSPLNPDKLDSGSSEGSPDEQSPILERRMMESPNPPINLSANNPFALDAKMSLLQEMADEMEVKVSDKAKDEEVKRFGAFDLVKEAEETTPAQVKVEEPVKQVEQKDWFSSHLPPKVTGKFEPVEFESEKAPAEDSDSESPTADSLSPVLEVITKNPASFQVEKKNTKVELEEPEVADEVSEHEVSSEEFEFIERPPKGVIDEFLEALDTSKFAAPKVPEIPVDEVRSFEQISASAPVLPEIAAEVPSQSSYLLLTQSSSQKSKADPDPDKFSVREPASQTARPNAAVLKPEEAVAQESAESGKPFNMPRVNISAVVDLLYWRDVKTTGVVFGAVLLLLLSLTACSIVSVCSYIGLALLSVTVCFRIYKGVLQAIQKSDEGHPFKQYLEREVTLSEDMVHKYSDVLLEKINKTVSELRRLFLVEDLVDSIKFAVLMWVLTYVGALFNGLTLVILAVIGAFSCPIIYEKHQAQIDRYLALVNNQIKDIVGKIQAKVPGMKRKAE